MSEKKDGKDVGTNPRGIPYAPFVDKVEDYVASRAEVDQTMKSFQEMISKYQFMEVNTQRRKAGLDDKIPDLQRSLDTVRFLKTRKPDSDPLEATFELNDTLYAKALVPPTEEVYLWLGANVMLSYPVDEAETMLEGKLSGAQQTLQNCDEDLDFLREQITTLEVATARVYNWDVTMRRKEKAEGGEDGGKAAKKLLKQPNDDVARFAPLFSYFYKTTVTEGDELGNETQVEKTFPTRFESNAEGKLKSWKIEKGAVVNNSRVVICEIDEPCSHSIQFAGMCANCGKDMTETSYVTEQLDSSRATINMVHNNVALTVSADEATRVEDEAKRRLIANTKLSLVVDLDQTIIHATVDPTVAEWQKDESNPNHESVKDVKSFLLRDDGPGNRGCWYYVKLRPGLQQFLENVSQIYELHIYTMGTRQYAKNIADIVDPDHRVFGDRILSRDESGSMTAKNLQRLFPVDTKMVVIIDDRGDVWKWSPNLIKVRPYDFFVGIGDINSSFLPKKPELKAPKPKPDAPASNNDLADGAVAKEPEPVVNGGHHDREKEQVKVTKELLVDSNTSPLDRLVVMGGADDPARSAQATEQNETIAAQLEERPLLQQQKKLEEEEASAAAETAKEETDENKSVSDKSSDSDKPKQNLLRDQDQELYKLENHLRAVHTAFFNAHEQLKAERQKASSQGGRVGQLLGVPKKKVGTDASDLDLVPDIKNVMPRVKSNVLANTVIVFSALFPQNVDMRTTDWGIQAAEFGARIDFKVTRRTTHLVAAPKKTDKVKLAQHKRHWKISIVSRHWLEDCFSSWLKLDEEPYLLDIEGPKDDLLDIENDSFSNSDADSQSEETEESEIDSPEHSSEKPGNLRLDTKPPPSDVDYESEMDPSENANFEYDNQSPVGTSADWDEMDAEMRKYLAEEGLESEDDNASDVSRASNTSKLSTRVKKRSREDYESGGEDDGEKAKKKQTTATSLSQTVLAGEDDNDADAPPEEDEPADVEPVQEGDGWSDFDEDEFDAELEKANSEGQDDISPV